MIDTLFWTFKFNNELPSTSKKNINENTQNTQTHTTLFHFIFNLLATFILIIPKSSPKYKSLQQKYVAVEILPNSAELGWHDTAKPLIKFS